MYDLHNHVLFRNNSEELKRFGVKGASALFADKFDQKKLSELKEKVDFDIVPAVEIHATRAGEVKKAVDKWRNQVDIIMVHAKDQRAVRAAAENPAVDMISHAFVDQTAAREAGTNNVALEINLCDLLALYGMKQAIWISKLKFNLRLARKYKVQLVLTTGAQTIYDMRSPKQMIALAECIGLTHEEAKKALLVTPKELVMKNREIRKGNAPVKGVKIVKRK